MAGPWLKYLGQQTQLCLCAACVERRTGQSAFLPSHTHTHTHARKHPPQLTRKIRTATKREDDVVAVTMTQFELGKTNIDIKM